MLTMDDGFHRSWPWLEIMLGLSTTTVRSGLGSVSLEVETLGIDADGVPSTTQ